MKRERKLPNFRTREEEARFWDTHSMTDYLGELEPADDVFTLAPSLAEKIRERAKTRAISLRLPQWEIDGAKRVAKKNGVGYQVLINIWIAEALRREARRCRWAT
ncbi:MAG: hypothetical protein HY922_03405 [Elusimicrobia bacterium]|nr:hypothetical protein [Elusimicrobiota bacterium]